MNQHPKSRLVPGDGANQAHVLLRHLPMLAVAILLAGWPPAQEVWAQQPGKVSATATLSILTGDIKHVPAGGSQPQAAKDGMIVAIGDRVLTGAKSFAVVTFLDGSTLVVCPNTDVTIKQAEVGGGKASRIGIRINFGLVWARVVRLLDPTSSFSLEANTVVASVHDGLIGAKQNPDGSFECWTQAGEVTLQDKFDRQSVRTFTAGQKVTIEPGQVRPPAPKPFAVNQSALRITASPNVLPLVLMAEKARVAGFVAPGIEVNQVLGSLTSAAADGARIVEVPAGVAGPYLLVLEGRQDGPFKVTLTGSFKGGQVYQQEVTGSIKKGERLSTQITQQMDPATAEDPKTAKVLSGSAAALQRLSGPLPGNILLSPMELQAAGGM